MKVQIESLIKRAFGGLGLDVRRLPSSDDPFDAQARLVKSARPVVFDVGAYVGDVTAAYRKLFPVSTVHAFEPFPDSFVALKDRFAGDAMVKANNLALCDVEESISLNANTSSATNSILPTDPLAAHSWGERLIDTRSVVRAQATTIDGYCSANGVESIDILKLDIQGAELRALRGARQMLEQGRISVIYMELIVAPTYSGQPSFEDYLRFLGGHQFVIQGFYNQIRKEGRLLQLDMILIHASKP